MLKRIFLDLPPPSLTPRNTCWPYGSADGKNKVHIYQLARLENPCHTESRSHNKHFCEEWQTGRQTGKKFASCCHAAVICRPVDPSNDLTSIEVRKRQLGEWNHSRTRATYRRPEWPPSEDESESHQTYTTSYSSSASPFFVQRWLRPSLCARHSGHYRVIKIDTYLAPPPSLHFASNTIAKHEANARMGPPLLSCLSPQLTMQWRSSSKTRIIWNLQRWR